MSYFRGYVAHMRHPHMPATGTEGMCELCGHGSDSPLHEKPWVKEGDEAAAAIQVRAPLTRGYARLVSPTPKSASVPTKDGKRRHRCAVCKESSGRNLMCDQCRRSYNRWRDSKKNNGMTLSVIRWAATRARAAFKRKK